MDGPLYDHELDAVPRARQSRTRPLLTRKFAGKSPTQVGTGIDKGSDAKRLVRWVGELSLTNVIGIGLMVGFLISALPMLASKPSPLGVSLYVSLLLFIPLACWVSPRTFWSAIRPRAAARGRDLAKVAVMLFTRIRENPRARLMAALVLVIAALITASSVSEARRGGSQSATLVVAAPAAVEPPPVPRPVPRPDGWSRIRDHHRDRMAVVYVRQTDRRNSPDDLTFRLSQYGLYERALSLGWPRERILVIDDSENRSAREPGGPSGFPRLLDEVCKDHVGMVLGFELQRTLSDPDRWILSEDWPRLLSVCDTFDTLLADQDRINDLREPSSNLKLQFATMRYFQLASRRREEIARLHADDETPSWLLMEPGGALKKARGWAREERQCLDELAFQNQIVESLEQKKERDAREERALTEARRVSENAARNAQHAAESRQRFEEQVRKKNVASQ